MLFINLLTPNVRYSTINLYFVTTRAMCTGNHKNHYNAPEEESKSDHQNTEDHTSPASQYDNFNAHAGSNTPPQAQPNPPTDSQHEFVDWESFRNVLRRSNEEGAHMNTDGSVNGLVDNPSLPSDIFNSGPLEGVNRTFGDFGSVLEAPNIEGTNHHLHSGYDLVFYEKIEPLNLATEEQLDALWVHAFGLNSHRPTELTVELLDRPSTYSDLLPSQSIVDLPENMHARLRASMSLLRRTHAAFKDTPKWSPTHSNTEVIEAVNQSNLFDQNSVTHLESISPFNNHFNQNSPNPVLENPSPVDINHNLDEPVYDAFGNMNHGYEMPESFLKLEGKWLQDKGTEMYLNSTELVARGEKHGLNVNTFGESRLTKEEILRCADFTPEDHEAINQQGNRYALRPNTTLHEAVNIGQLDNEADQSEFQNQPIVSDSHSEESDEQILENQNTTNERGADIPPVDAVDGVQSDSESLDFNFEVHREGENNNDLFADENLELAEPLAMPIRTLRDVLTARFQNSSTIVDLLNQYDPRTFITTTLQKYVPNRYNLNNLERYNLENQNQIDFSLRALPRRSNSAGQPSVRNSDETFIHEIYTDADLVTLLEGKISLAREQWIRPGRRSVDMDLANACHEPLNVDIIRWAVRLLNRLYDLFINAVSRASQSWHEYVAQRSQVYRTGLTDFNEYILLWFSNSANNDVAITWESQELTTQDVLPGTELHNLRISQRVLLDNNFNPTRLLNDVLEPMFDSLIKAVDIMRTTDVRFGDQFNSQIANTQRVEELRTVNDMVNANHHRRFLEGYRIHVDIVREKLEQRRMASTNQGFFRRTLGHIRRVNNDLLDYLEWFNLFPFMNYMVLGVGMAALVAFLYRFTHAPLRSMVRSIWRRTRTTLPNVSTPSASTPNASTPNAALTTATNSTTPSTTPSSYTQIVFGPILRIQGWFARHIQQMTPSELRNVLFPTCLAGMGFVGFILYLRRGRLITVLSKTLDKSNKFK